MAQTFYFDKALENLQAGKVLTGKDGILMPLIKQLTEAITAELNYHLSNSEQPNRKMAQVQRPLKQARGGSILIIFIQLY